MGWGKEGRERLKALGICTNCGKHPAKPGQTLCDGCREKMREYRKNVKDYRPVKRKIDYGFGEKKKPKQGYTLDDLAVMARNEGISYGQLVARLEGRNGKTE